VNETDIDIESLLVPRRSVVLVTRSGPPLLIRGQVNIVDREFFTVTISEATGATPEPGMVLGGAVFVPHGVYRFACAVVMYRPGRPSPLLLSPPESFEWIDRRTRTRVAAALPLTCVPVVSATESRAGAAGFAATTIDLSVGGLAVTTDQPVRLGQELRVALLLPHGEHVAARTTVLAVHPAHDPASVAVVHMQIDEIDPRHREQLEAFVHEAAFFASNVDETSAILRRPLVAAGQAAAPGPHI
jgi:Tfp pilus assembly protein PilZ